jgi:DNA-3-methyladenine glycosylase
MLEEGVTALPREFYQDDTVTVAQRLLNCRLVYETEQGTLIGRISETEAYTQHDPACHTFRGKTPRNAIMFGPPGHAYIYFTYGMYHCLNAVTAPEHVGEAVLIRAVEPLAGLELMRARRRLSVEGAPKRDERQERIREGRALCGGPGKVCMAFGLDRSQNGLDLTERGSLWIAPPEPDTPPLKSEAIHAAPRIGISQATNRLWRFYMREEPFLSRK